MQEYRRQIAYLHAYVHGVRMHSFGFAKAETRGMICRLSICLKGFCYPGEEAGKVYIYFYHNHRIVGIYLGSLQGQNGTFMWQGTVDSQNVLDTGIHISDTNGMWVRRPGNREYVAEWEDRPVDTARFLLYPKGGEKCIRCPRFGNCRRSTEDVYDGR